MPWTQDARRLTALFDYIGRLSNEQSGGVFGDALDLLVETRVAVAAIAFAVASGNLERVADRGLPPPLAGNQRFDAQLASMAQGTLGLRRAALPAAVETLGTFADACRSAGAQRLIALPVRKHTQSLGVLILLTADDALSDRRFIDSVVHVLSLGLNAESRSDEERARRGELEQTQRMASLGLLTATLSKELDGPVRAVALEIEEHRRQVESLELLAGSVDSPLGAAVAELRELGDALEAATRRLETTVHQLETLSAADSMPQAIELSAVVDEALNLARSSLRRRNIQLQENLEPTCTALGRREDLAQVVLNLLFNAADACERQPGGKRLVKVRTHSDDDQVYITVEDSGPGVADEAIRLIFRPFYTTKQQGIGLGLGLKVCSDVVASHGGHIEVDQSADGGAAFRVVLKKHKDSSGVHPVARATQRAGSDRTRTRSVLIIDDDPVFSRSVRRGLGGYDVRTVSSASEAEIALLDPRYRPDLVLCDVMLPGINGNQLHARVASHRPDLAERFVFITGGALGKSEADYLRESGCPTLLKPLQPSAIADIIGPPTPDSAPPPSVQTLSGPPEPATARPGRTRSTAPPAKS